MTFVATTSPRIRHRDGTPEPLNLGQMVALGSDRQVADDQPTCVVVLPSGVYALETTPGGEVRVMRQPSKTLDRSRPMTSADLQKINIDYWSKQANKQSR